MMADAVITSTSVTVARSRRHLAAGCATEPPRDNGAMGRLATSLFAIALVSTACSDDTATPEPPSTVEATSAPPSTTATTPPAADPVALTVRAGSVADDVPVRDVAVTYLGTRLGPDPDWPVDNFAGVAGPASGDRLAASPVVYDGSTDDTWPQDANGSLIRRLTDDILPRFEYDRERRIGLVRDWVDQVFVADVGISGTVVPVTWEQVSADDDHIVIRVDSDFEQENIQRGHRFVTAGTVTGEFRVGRTNGMDLEGRVDIEFDVVDDTQTSVHHQWWEATPAPATPDPEEWRIASDGIARFSDMLADPPDDPDAFRATFGYGGADWSGRLEVERFWTQADYTVGATTVRATLDVDSRFTLDGQWLTTDLIDWESDGPPFGETTVDDEARAVLPPPFALLVAPDGRIGNAYLQSSDELASRNQRTWFGQLLREALPSFPEDELGPGARWQSRVQGDQDGTGPVSTVIAVDGDELHLEVGGSYGAYFGDRYDGYLVDAEIAGTIVLHWGAAIPLEVDIETTGTITFGTGGEPDPSTTEPWRSTLRVRATTPA